MKQKKIKILSILYNKYKNKKIELNYKSPFQLLISLILSAKSRDKQVNKITKKLFKIADNPKKILKLGYKKLKIYIKKIGLYKKKSKYIIKTCSIIVKKYKQNILKLQKNILKLPGIGEKSKNIFLNEIFNIPSIAIDTHVFRICKRINLIKSNTIYKMQKKINKNIPKKFKKNFHNIMVFHGKNTCTAKNPKCKKCIIKNLCKFQLNKS